MAEVGRIRSRFELEIAGFQRSMQRMQRSLDRTQRELRETGQTGTRTFNNIERSARRTTGVVQGLGAAFAAIATLQVARNIGQTAVAFENLNTRLRFLVGSQEQANAAFARIRALAREAGANVLDLTDSYAQLIGATRGAAFSQAEIEELFRAITIAGRALGATNDQVRLAFIGLSQALGSSNVQYQEIRQITESLPGTLTIMARAVGKTTGEFRDFIATGKVTPQEVFIPFARAANREFLPALEGIRTNASAAFNQVINAWNDMVKALVDQGALQAVARALNFVEEGIRGLGDAAASITRFFVDPARTLRAELSRAQAELSALQAITDPLPQQEQQIENLTAKVRILREELERLGAPKKTPRIVIDIPAPSRARPAERFPTLGIDVAVQSTAQIQFERIQKDMLRSLEETERAMERAAEQTEFTGEILQDTFQSIGDAIAQSAIGVARGTQTISQAISNMVASLGASLLSATMNRILGVLAELAVNALTTGIAGGTSSALSTPFSPAQLPLSGAARTSSATLPAFGAAARSSGLSIINVPDIMTGQRVAALEAAQGRSVTVNSLARSIISEGNGNSVVQALNAVRRP